MRFTNVPNNLQLGRQGQQAVAQGAQSSFGSGNALPSFSGSSTKLNIAGNTGYQQLPSNFPKFNLNQQGNIPGQKTNSPPPAPGSRGGGWQPGQDVNTAGVSAPQGVYVDPTMGGFGRSDRPDLSNPFKVALYQKYLQSIKPPVPTPAPTPTMPPQTQTQARPVGSTAQLPSVSGGTVGQGAFPALTQAGQATKGLQSIKGLGLDFSAPQAPSAQMMPQLPSGPANVSPQFISQLQDSLGARTPQAQQNKPSLPLQGDSSQRGPSAQMVPGQNTGAGNVINTLGPLGMVGAGLGGAMLGPAAMAIAPEIAAAAPFLENLGGMAKRFLPAGIAAGGGLTAAQLAAGQNKADAAFNPQARQFVGPTAEMLPKGPDQTGKTLAPGVTDVKGINKGIQQVVSGKGDLQNIAANIASPNAIPEINKAIDVAQQSGDFDVIQKLVSLASAVRQNINFQQQMGQVISALSAGFGTPNAPGVTQARLPGVQQGVFQALEGTPRPDFGTSPISAQSAQMLPYLPPNVQPAETQQNKPILNPFMGR